MPARSGRSDAACRATEDWRVEGRTRTGSWKPLPETATSQGDAEDLADHYRVEGLVSGKDRPFTRLRIVAPPGVKRQPRRSRVTAARDAAMAMLADERAAALERLPELRAQGDAAAACGHPQPPPSDGEVAACPELLLRQCASCAQRLWWQEDEWHVLPVGDPDTD